MNSTVANAPRFSVPADVFDWRITAASKLVYLLLCKMADSETGKSWPGKRYIAAKCGVSYRTVTRCVRELRLMGLITVEARYFESEYCGRQQRSNLYTVYDRPGAAFENVTEGQKGEDILARGGGHTGPGGRTHRPAGTFSNELNSKRYKSRPWRRNPYIKPTRFSNFKERDIDFEKLERLEQERQARKIREMDGYDIGTEGGGHDEHVDA